MLLPQNVCMFLHASVTQTMTQRLKKDPPTQHLKVQVCFTPILLSKLKKKISDSTITPMKIIFNEKVVFFLQQNTAKDMYKSMKEARN